MIPVLLWVIFKGAFTLAVFGAVQTDSGAVVLHLDKCECSRRTSVPPNMRRDPFKTEVLE